MEVDADVDLVADGLADLAEAPDRGGGGEVHVLRGLFRNNNIAGVRLGTKGSSVRGTVIVQDELSPPGLGGGRNQRGLWLRNYVPDADFVVEDVHITQTVGYAPFITGSTGTASRVRIHTDTKDHEAIAVNDTTFAGDDIDVTGSGNLFVPESSFTDVCTGDDCEVPVTTMPEPCL